STVTSPCLLSRVRSTPSSPSFPYTTLFRSGNATRERFTNTRTFLVGRLIRWSVFPMGMEYHLPHHLFPLVPHYCLAELHAMLLEDRKSTRLNSSHEWISYAVFCLKKKKTDH